LIFHGLRRKDEGGKRQSRDGLSCLFGMVSGSAVANVMTMDPLTIPMMEKSGYSKRFCGAIRPSRNGRAVHASLHGRGAFIISETLGALT
jgi:TRAP-type uncharacterized transport system fused permease subunit